MRPKRGQKEVRSPDYKHPRPATGYIARRYGGKLVYETRDEMGDIEVVDHLGTRSLFLGNAIKQSTLNFSKPTSLEFEYTQAMAAGLLFSPEPQRVLVAGFGGGSLVSFLAHHYNCSIDVLEIREDLIEIGQNYFGVPESNAIQYFIGDALEFFKSGQGFKYDLIFIDLYDSMGMSEKMRSFNLQSKAKGLLAPDGLCIFNLWTLPNSLSLISMFYLKEVFGRQLAQLPCVDTSNLIAIGSKDDAFKISAADLRKKAKSFDRAHDFSLTRHTETLIKENPNLFRKNLL
ncbi:MAG: hypothetical protein QNL04_12050 [SAR324 cluster bacterium]|nr:hypothetical protein [SAR324 cluster bacterium]